MRNYKSVDMIFRQRENDPSEAFSNAFYRNPMLVTAAGANLIAGGCITLSNGVVMTLMLFILLPLAGLAASALKDRLSPVMKPAAYAAASAVIMLAYALLCNAAVKGSADSLGVFLPLTALDTLVFFRLAKSSKTITAAEGLASGAGTACAFALIALPIAFLRGLFGGGIFFGEYAFDAPEALQSPFFGFIICGVALALFKKFVMTSAPDRDGDE